MAPTSAAARKSCLYVVFMILSFLGLIGLIISLSRCQGDAFLSARRKRVMLSASASRTRSVSRLNSAAPYNTHACPPINRARTRCAWIEERTLRIGFGINRTSQNQERLPQFLALQPSFGRA